MENNLPAAEEFFIQKGFMKPNQKLGYDIKTAMIEFAKLHIEAQKQTILTRLEKRHDHNNLERNIILNAYPLNKIK